jgi:hypothetical protein
MWIFDEDVPLGEWDWGDPHLGGDDDFISLLPRTGIAYYTTHLLVLLSISFGGLVITMVEYIKDWKKCRNRIILNSIRRK